MQQFPRKSCMYKVMKKWIQNWNGTNYSKWDKPVFYWYYRNTLPSRHNMGRMPQPNQNLKVQKCPEVLKLHSRVPQSQQGHLLYYTPGPRTPTPIFSSSTRAGRMCVQGYYFTIPTSESIGKFQPLPTGTFWTSLKSASVGFCQTTWIQIFPCSSLSIG